MTHFPALARRLNYKTKSDGNHYANYSVYYDEIAEDCQNRCVYCDAMLEEIGGEGMNLDHFKPQKHFLSLANDPSNLVLACFRCNRLKSDWWPEKDGTCNNGQHGFIDPFSPDKDTYFLVEENGEITPKKVPYGYMVELMNLNRISRVAIRRRRTLQLHADQLIEQILLELDNLANLPVEQIRQRADVLSAALKQVRLIMTGK
ncbi:HNH endonuclease [Roseateles chitinivorans]|uniref:HNH endonuclease n=1 Tax=Roseateles chitinivorans TaxID=2917965 RepID=UPI003D66F7FF